MEFDPEVAKRQIDLVEVGVNTHGAVIANEPLQTGEEQTVQIQMRVEQAYGVGGLCEAFLRRLTGGGMNPEVIALLKPGTETCVEFLKGADALARETQGGLKLLLKSSEHPFDLSLGPGVVGFGVKEANTEIGADNLDVVIDEGPPRSV